MSDLRPQDRARLRRVFRFIDDEAPLSPGLDELVAPRLTPDRRLGANPWRVAAGVFAVLLVLAVPAAFLMNSGSATGPLDPADESDVIPAEGRGERATTPLGPNESETQAFAGFPFGPQFARTFMVSAAFQRAMEHHVAECMTAKGFVYKPHPEAAPEQPALSVAEVRAQRYVAPTVIDGIFGYSFSDDNFDVGNAEPADRGDPAETEAYAAALYGTSESLSTEIAGIGGGAVGELTVGDGCSGEALTGIFGSLEQYAEYVQLQSIADQIAGIAWSRLMTEQAGADASQEWSDCMAAAGHDYKRPMDVGNRDWAEPRPQAEEQAVAQADHECRVETMVEQKLAEIDGQYQQELLEDYPDLLETLDEYNALLVQKDPALLTD